MAYGLDDHLPSPLHDRHHYKTITQLFGFLGRGYICPHSLRVYNNRGQHACPSNRPVYCSGRSPLQNMCKVTRPTVHPLCCAKTSRNLGTAFICVTAFIRVRIASSVRNICAGERGSSSIGADLSPVHPLNDKQRGRVINASLKGNCYRRTLDPLLCMSQRPPSAQSSGVIYVRGGLILFLVWTDRVQQFLWQLENRRTNAGLIGSQFPGQLHHRRYRCLV